MSQTVDQQSSSVGASSLGPSSSYTASPALQNTDSSAIGPLKQDEAVLTNSSSSLPCSTFPNIHTATNIKIESQIQSASSAHGPQGLQQLAGISATELLSTVGGGQGNVAGMGGIQSRGKVEVKLFVGRLPRTIDETALTPMFTSYGEVLETVIIRDKATGMHKGSAFVKMASLTEADSAVRSLHNLKVIDPQLGPIQVKYANGEPERLGLSTDSAQAGNDLGKLFVGSLPRGVTETEVREVFEPYGKVDEVVLMKDATTGQSKGCAFVKFGLKEQAIHAIKGLHGLYTFTGCPRALEVKFAENRRAMTPAGSPFGGAIQNPGSNIIRQASSTMIMTAASPPPSNLNPRSISGWTEYFTADGRAYYYHELTKVTQWTKPLEFERLGVTGVPPVPASPSLAPGSAVPGGTEVAGPPGANVFVFHIPNEWGQNEVVSHFSQFGRVISCYVATDKTTGRNKGYGFVSFDNIQSAASAVMTMNGFPVGSKRLKVSIKTGEESYVAHLLGGQQPVAGAVSHGPGGYGSIGMYGGMSNVTRASPY